ncbi:MAG: Mor transcription activator family protein [Romboutsia timonensis]|uniref:Mor transcription activator family protein n=1 Tax=Romboutsia timonensis TaxID=1776391 RepID=UPI002A753F14|nr:Mor transcription activator family protein [Romboutsia timonensis]MDY3001198.1 Mor transcription activator family protein [Romboutsia timonensis]
MIDKLTIDDVPENLKSVAYAIGIDAFKSLIKCAGGTSVYLPSERCITKPIRDRVIRDSFCGDYREMAKRFGISEVRVRRIVGEKS